MVIYWRPRSTICDDPQERLRFRNLLANLARGEIAILLSTHIVGDISSTCTDVALLNEGEVVFVGPPDKLVDTARGKVWKIVASHGELDDLKQRFPVVSTVPAAAGYEVRLVASTMPQSSAEQVAPNLEDAYIHYMESIGQDMSLEAAVGD